MATVLVLGASRGVGLETTRQALAAGHTVRGLSRSKPAIRSSTGAFQFCQGDALDADDVSAALEGTDAVIQTLGIGKRYGLGAVTLFSDSTRILIAADRKSVV